MQQNESTLDRIIRAIAGVVFLVLGIMVFDGALAIFFDILGAIMLFTAVTGFCTIYKIFGFSTKKNK